MNDCFPSNTVPERERSPQSPPQSPPQAPPPNRPGTTIRERLLFYRAPLALGIICLLATASLTLLYQSTREKIAYVRLQYMLSAFATLLERSTDRPIAMPTAQVPKPVRVMANMAFSRSQRIADSLFVDTLYYLPADLPPIPPGFDPEDFGPLPDSPELFILKLNAQGYGGQVRLLAAYRRDGGLYHAIMLENNETPGFGKKAEDPAYMKMFWDRSSSSSSGPIPISKAQAIRDGFPLDAVSGSTISFRAISKALRAGADYLWEHSWPTVRPTIPAESQKSQKSYGP
ncbi:MAG: FMN-binding protein [Spirochaetota bacterium]